MQYLAAVVRKGFYVGAWSQAGAFVVHHDGKVLDASPLALARGVREEMGLAEARTILGPGGVCLAWEPAPYRAAQAQWLE
ncbi:MAG: hypothetical protein C4320_05475, partial [Armatimonadota bacterium]